MTRTHTFTLKPTKEEGTLLFDWADTCAALYTEINYTRRQSFFAYTVDWTTDDIYHPYKKVIGSATAQQFINKNNEAWKSFFALLKSGKKENWATDHVLRVLEGWDYGKASTENFSEV
jgi:putative transposase